MISTRLPRFSAAPAESDRGSRSLAPEAALLTTIALWSSTFIITKDQLDIFSPFSFIFTRFLLMVSMAVAIMVIQVRGLPRPAPL